MTGFLLGAGNIAAQFNATNKGPRSPSNKSTDRSPFSRPSRPNVSIFDRFGATATALGGSIENVGKVPHSVTNITGDNNAVANGGNATSTQSTSTNMDCSGGPGGTGVPATQSQSQTQGQQGQTTNSQTNAGTTGARPARSTAPTTKSK